MKHLLIIFLAFTASFASAEDSATEALGILQKKLASLTAYEADFVQATKDSLGKVLQSIKGSMQVQKPGKLRWETDGEYGQLVISDGKSVWVYDADLEQVTIKTMDNRLSETPALLLGGDASAISQDFLVSLEKAGDKEHYQLVPKDPAQLFDALELIFSQDVLSRMIIRDASGQITEIDFTGGRNNPSFKEDLFTFTPPENADVIDGRQ